MSERQKAKQNETKEIFSFIMPALIIFVVDFVIDSASLF